MKIDVVKVPAQLVAGIRQKGQYRQIGNMIPKLYQYAGSKGAKFTGMPTLIMHETKEQAAEADKNGTAALEVVAPIAEKIEESAEVKCYMLEGGEMVKTTYKGPYDQMGPVYDSIFNWIKEHHKKATGPIREVYLNEPVTPDESLTEIYVPVG